MTGSRGLLLSALRYLISLLRLDLWWVAIELALLTLTARHFADYPSPQDISIWLIGLAVASASSAIVCCMCTYFVIRTRIAAREAASANQTVHFGAAAVPAGGAQEGEGVRESVARFLHTFPTFEFSEERVSVAGLTTLK